MLLDGEGRRDAVEDLAGERRDVVLLDVREEEDELVAADARDRVAGADDAAQARADLAKDLVADAGGPSCRSPA